MRLIGLHLVDEVLRAVGYRLVIVDLAEHADLVEIGELDDMALSCGGIVYQEGSLDNALRQPGIGKRARLGLLKNDLLRLER